MSCIFVGNTAGTGAAFASADADGFEIMNCAIVDNHAGAGSAGLSFDAGPAVFENCILWGNTPGQITSGEPFAAPAYSCVQGGLLGIGNINADPLFARNPDPGADRQWGTSDDDYGDLHLRPNSPAIDAGNPAFVLGTENRDLDGELRIWAGAAGGAGRVDMGVDEFGSFGFGDLDCDQRIDNLDIDAFVLAISDAGAYAALHPRCDARLADVNGDGRADNFDVDQFVECLVTGGCP